jgi:hypothetical protein
MSEDAIGAAARALYAQDAPNYSWDALSGHEREPYYARARTNAAESAPPPEVPPAETGEGGSGEEAPPDPDAPLIDQPEGSDLPMPKSKRKVPK